MTVPQSNSKTPVFSRSKKCFQRSGNFRRRSRIFCAAVVNKRGSQPFKNRTAETKESAPRQRRNCAAIGKDKAVWLRGANDNFLITVSLFDSFSLLVTVLFVAKGADIMPKRRANGEGNIRKRKDGRWEGRYTVGHNPETGKAIIKNVLAKGADIMPKRRANGEGNIRKRKDGRWEGRYTVGHNPETGKAIIKNVLGKTQAEVKEKLKKAEGNIRKRKDGRWEGRYTVGHNPETGKAIIKNVLGKTQAEVKEKLKKAIEENVGIDYGRAKNYTVGSWLEVWMENYAKIKLRPSTFKTSQGFLKNHIKPQIGSIPLADLTSLDLQRFYKHLLDGGRVDRVEAKKKPKGLAPKTVRNIHQMIGSAYNLAIEQHLVTKNPTQGCALPKVEHKEMKTLTADQLSAFFQEARDSGVYELYYLDLATGLRRGELLGLKWTDVDLVRGVLKIQRAISRQNGKVVEAPLKTKNAYRTLPLSADAIDVLMQQRRKTGNSEWVFPSPTGGPMSPDSVLHMLQRVLKRAGLPRIRFHDLRHTFATMALQNGVDVKTVSSMLGHYSAGFTLDTYAHVTTDAQLKAAQTMGNILSRAI